MWVFILISSIFICWGLYELYFYLTHRHPLTSDEIFQLAKKRRNKKIESYYTFSNIERVANVAFKSKMKPTGQLYEVNEALDAIPDIVAALLKGKKHEWIVFAFEKEQHINYLLMNKGMDNRSVHSAWSMESIKDFALSKNSTSILGFHNHPNSNPNLLDCTKPSDTDLKSAALFSNILSLASVNLIEFVCERGRHYRYYQNFSDTFMPVKIFVQEVEAVNGADKHTNYILHKELIRGK